MSTKLPATRPMPEQTYSKQPPARTQPSYPAGPDRTQENLTPQPTSQTSHPTPVRNPLTHTITLDKTPMDTSAPSSKISENIPDQSQTKPPSPVIEVCDLSQETDSEKAKPERTIEFIKGPSKHPFLESFSYGTHVADLSPQVILDWPESQPKDTSEASTEEPRQRHHFHITSPIKDPSKTATVKPTTAGDESPTLAASTREPQVDSSPENGEEHMEVENNNGSPPEAKRPCMKEELRKFRPTKPHRWGDTWTDEEWQEPEDRSRVRKVAQPFEFPKPDPPSQLKHPFESTRIHKWIFDKLPHKHGTICSYQETPLTRKPCYGTWDRTKNWWQVSSNSFTITPKPSSGKPFQAKQKQ